MIEMEITSDILVDQFGQGSEVAAYVVTKGIPRDAALIDAQVDPVMQTLRLTWLEADECEGELPARYMRIEVRRIGKSYGMPGEVTS